MVLFDIPALRQRLRVWLSSSISNRITFAALSLTMVVALVIGGSSYAVVTLLVHRSITVELETQARLTMQKLETDLSGVSNDLASMAANSFIANGLVDSLGRDTYLLPFLREHRLAASGRNAIVLCDFQGRPIASNLNAIPDISIARTGIEKVIEQGKPFSAIRRSQGGAVLVLVQPVIFPPTGQTEGVLVETADLQELFASSTKHLDSKHLATLLADEAPLARSAKGTTDDLITVQYRLPLALPLQSLNLVFQVGKSRASAYGPLRWVGAAYLLLGVLTLILVLKFSRTTAQRLTTPLTTLSLAASRISEGGSWSLGTEIAGDDEVASLARAFTRMLTKLAAAREFLEAQVEERTHELKEAHDRLEDRVAQRTSELIEANLRLEREILTSAQLEQQLRQIQKMEAIGTLAGGIAHDFNNILTVIGSYSVMTQLNMAEDDPLRENLDHIVEATERAANLTRSLLAFSRKQVMDQRHTDLNDIVCNVEKFLLRVIGEDIQLSTVRKTPVLPVHADCGQIEQVLMNLAANARDAMPKGGVLTIQTALELLDEAYVSAHGYPQTPGRYAVVTVTDTGTGMDEETQRKIFEPFYTTKEVGKGTGLGLSMAYGIIKQHNGYITVHSKLGEGTTFRIFLPVLEARPQFAPEQAAPAASHQGGSETVLVAEDDAKIREVVASLLGNAGYKVLTAKDGQEAVEVFARHRGEVRLVLMDMVMPRKSGKDAHQAMRQLEPGVRVLFSSGYTADFIKSRGDVEEGTQLIMKPVHPAELLAKVREMLDAAESTRQ